MRRTKDASRTLGSMAKRNTRRPQEDRRLPGARVSPLPEALRDANRPIAAADQTSAVLFDEGPQNHDRLRPGTNRQSEAS